MYVRVIIIIIVILLLLRRKSNTGAKFPKHWKSPPSIQTADYRQFPPPYEKYYGSSTMVNWILNNQENDRTSPWENLVGFQAAYAKQVINENRPDLQIYVINQNDLVTQDYRTDRVRIFVDEYQIVVGGNKTPQIG
uniref:Potato inhibitor I family protein n=1 Tax=Megaviridae environmental sample TaxID=1737588 RepID=A0A5J6VI93_9VIRU|nr:MAG: potato inhibitor I family protein [Megaviridae environmental sample]